MKNTAVKNYSSFAFTIFTIMIFAFFAIRPTIGTIISLQKSLEEQTTISNNLELKATNLTEGKKNYQAIDNTTGTQINNMLPSRTNLPSLIQSLNNYSNQAGAVVAGIQFQTVELTGQPTAFIKNPQLQEINFTYNVQGTYSQLKEILQKVTRSTRLITIQSVNFTSVDDQQLLMSVNAKAYFLKNE